MAARTVDVSIAKNEIGAKEGRRLPRGVAPRRQAADRTQLPGIPSCGQGSDPGNRKPEVKLKGQQHVITIHAVALYYCRKAAS